jgi:catechol 2,3-dioxygenase-like lactoylglutathione lyase family enzyme
MKQHLGLVSLVVRDYDEALEYFVGKLGFEPYGTVAVFRDLYGNLRDLIQPTGRDES